MKRIAKLILMTLLAVTILAGCGSFESNATPSCDYVADDANNRIVLILRMIDKCLLEFIGDDF